MDFKLQIKYLTGDLSRGREKKINSTSIVDKILEQYLPLFLPYQYLILAISNEHL
jgi:hypothetical protein